MEWKQGEKRKLRKNNVKGKERKREPEKRKRENRR